MWFPSYSGRHGFSGGYAFFVLNPTHHALVRNNPTVAALPALGSSLLGTLLLPNIVALVLDKVLGSGMSWFATEYSVVLLFVPAALLGSCTSFIVLYHWVLIETIFTQARYCHSSSYHPTSSPDPTTQTQQTWNKQHSKPSSSSNPTPPSQSNQLV
jgi:hypothetical protein